MPTAVEYIILLISNDDGGVSFKASATTSSGDSTVTIETEGLALGLAMATLRAWYGPEVAKDEDLLIVVPDDDANAGDEVSIYQMTDVLITSVSTGGSASDVGIEYSLGAGAASASEEVGMIGFTAQTPSDFLSFI